jgi:hypothetical protein
VQNLADRLRSLLRDEEIVGSNHATPAEVRGHIQSMDMPSGRLRERLGLRPVEPLVNRTREWPALVPTREGVRHACPAGDNRCVTEPQPLQRPTFYDIYDEPRRRYLSPTRGAVLTGLVVLVALTFGCGLLVRTVERSHRGVVVNAEVVGAQHGSRSDFVTVHLPAPVDKNVDLSTRSGKPEPGDVIAVRYYPASPTTAWQAGTWPWQLLLAAFGVGGWFAFGCWWSATRPWRRHRTGLSN